MSTGVLRRVDTLRQLVGRVLTTPSVWRARASVPEVQGALREVLAGAEAVCAEIESPGAVRTHLPLSTDLRTALQLAMSREVSETLVNAETYITGALIRLMLDLPAGVSIVLPNLVDTFVLRLRVASLPDVEPGRPLHLVQFIYRRVETGAAELQEMKVTHSWERDDA